MAINKTVSPGEELPVTAILNGVNGVPPLTYDISWLVQPDPDITFAVDNENEVRFTAGPEILPAVYDGILRGTVTDAWGRVRVADLPVTVNLAELAEFELVWTQGQATTHGFGFLSNTSYGNGTYIAGWWDPSIEYTTDGVTWTAVTANMNLTWDSAYGQGKFIVVGEQSNGSGPGRIVDSVDGTSWTLRTNPFTEFTQSNNVPRTIIYSPDLDLWFMAARGNGYKTSPDGLNWSALQTVAEFDPWGYMRGSWGDGKFVITDQKDIAISTDGVNWTVTKFDDLPMSGSDTLEATAAGGGVIVALGRSVNAPQRSGVYSTDNGATWNLISIPGHDFVRFEAVEYGDGKFIATGSFNIFPSYIVISEDGINWAIQEGYDFGSDSGYDVAYNADDNEWMVVGDFGYTAFGQLQEIIPPPPIPDPPPTVEDAWSTDLIATTGTSGSQDASPVNIYYRRTVFTTTYSSEEIALATGKTEATIVGLRFDVTEEPLNQPLPDYAIGMKRVSGGASADNSGGGFTVVKASANESFTTGTTKEFIFDTPIVWVAGYNIAVSWAWGQVQPDYDASGRLPIGNGSSNYALSDSAGAYTVNDPADTTGSYRPVIQFRT